MGFRETCEEIFCVYKSTRFLRVKNYKLSVVYYTTLVGVLLYVVLFTVIDEKGYQYQDPVTGTTSAKIKGTASVGGVQGSVSGTVYDAMDIVVPSIEENAFFVTTGMILTPSQSRDKCPGNDDVPACDSSNYTTVCIKGTYDTKSQGIWTGNCCSSSITNNGNCSSSYTPNDHCEVKSWCPLEDDDDYQSVVNVGNFTAFIKVDVDFAFWKETRSNVLDKNGDGSPVDGYNLWSIDEIVSNATNGEYKNISGDISKYGAIILMVSDWQCNFDKKNDDCQPSWQFHRIDSEPNTISQGFNFRDVTYDASMENRLLRKLYGVRVVFVTTGQGGAFYLLTLSVTLGAGLSYLAVAAIVTDIVLEKFLPQSAMYERMKNRDDAALLSLKGLTSNDRENSASTRDQLNAPLLSPDNEHQNGKVQ